jgi:hypothetical protein
MTEIDLTFISRQQDWILRELAEMRLEHRAGLQGVRDDMDVLKAMVAGLTNASRNQADINALIFEQLRGGGR